MTGVNFKRGDIMPNHENTCIQGQFDNHNPANKFINVGYGHSNSRIINQLNHNPPIDNHIGVTPYNVKAVMDFLMKKIHSHRKGHQS